jgi:Zn-dependent M32 family carboxypeptidase
MRFLAQESPIAAFIKNSLQLWYASQWEKDKNPAHIFYGYGSPQFAIFKQIERKRCLEGARKADNTGDLTHFIEPFEPMIQNIIAVGEELADFYHIDSAYEALREFHTDGYSTPFTKDNIGSLTLMVRSLQSDQGNVDYPHISRELHDKIINAMLGLAQIDIQHRVEILQTEAPACLGYVFGSVERGVKLGLTYGEKDPLKSLFNNWHEIGHACYRQHIPQGYMIAGRAMDEAIAFLFEYHIGYSDEFLQFLLDSGLRECGYTLPLLQSYIRQVKCDTSRIETNPLRHPIDIYINAEFEKSLLQEDGQGERPDVLFLKIIEPYRDIFPEGYSFYADSHIRGGIFGDREAYNAGYAAAFQLGHLLEIDMGNLVETVKIISNLQTHHFSKAIYLLTAQPLTIEYYNQWISKYF